QAYLYGRLDSFEMGNVSTHMYQEFIFSSFDVNRFELALNRLIQRHGALRTVFSQSNQRVLKEVPFYQVSNHGEVTQESLNEIRARLSHKVYDVSQWPFFDYEVSSFNGQSILHVSQDALIMDGSSNGIFFAELAKLYNAEDVNAVQLPQLGISFADYMQQFNLVRESHLFNDAKTYWVNKLPEYNFDAKLPMVTNPSLVKQPVFTRKTKTIATSLWQQFTAKADQYNVSPTAVVLFAYGYILQKYSGQSKFCINLTLFNRLPLHKQVNDIIGDFTVLELFNFQRQNHVSTFDAVNLVHNQLWEDIEHNLFDGIDFQRLIRKELGIATTQSLSPVVLTSVLGNNHADGFLEGYVGTGYSITQTSQVYLDNKAYETPEGFVAEWDYVEQLFDPELIGQMHSEYCALIETLAEIDWQLPLPQHPLASYDELIINKANSDSQTVVGDTMVLACFKQLQATKLKNHCAVSDVLGDTSYEELLKLTNAVSSYLVENNLARKNHLIGVLSEKGVNQVMATLGIMAAGGAYLPLHVDWPRGRCDEVLSEGQVQTVLISQAEYKGCIKGSEIEPKYQWVIIEELKNYQPSEATIQKLDAIQQTISLDDIAYVIFTSGSTGKPKGVTISHRGAMNTIKAVNERFDINSNDKVLALSELSFDLSVYDIFGVLAAGGTIVFPDQKCTKEPSHWYELINKHQINIWDTVPQLMQLLVDYAEDVNGSLESLKVVLMSGDWIPLSLPKQIKNVSPNATVMSLGGATEGSIWSIWYEIQDIDPEWKSIPYGVAMPNQKMYVLNDFGEHCPINVIGEIHIGGDGVALNYWQDSDKTQKSFIEHPELGRLYKTGDLGKWHKDGFITFEGRKDNQVKLNGYRVELDEIASKVAKVDGIETAIASVQDNQVVAYVVSEHFKSPDDKQHGIDKTQFKLEQKGLIGHQDTGRHLSGLSSEVAKLEDKYRLRKSYRQFTKDRITTNQHRVKELISGQTETLLSPNNKLSPIEQCLMVTSAIQLSDRVLPKYLYPSGGSSYAIRCYVSLGQGANVDSTSVDAGQYYYHPAKHALHHTDIHLPEGEAQLHFILHKPAIEPLYGEQQALKLAWLELGHLLCLVQQSCAKSLSFTVQDQNISDDDLLMVSITLEADNQGKQLVISLSEGVSFDYLTQTTNGFCDTQGHTFNIKDKPLPFQLSEFGQLLSQTGVLLCFTGNNQPQELLSAGYAAEYLSEALYQQNIGSCTLGFTPYDSVNYCLALGGITDEQKTQAESQAQALTLEAYIATQIKQHLPVYMRPSTFIPLSYLPLTANGKVDYKK
ncbi:amino acid adenylation domain-containing protein, partial [Francisellaceae bacterium]|nr:amino acid adenylation domain-containing protein [Francisellaceae bacterium]